MVRRVLLFTARAMRGLRRRLRNAYYRQTLAALGCGSSICDGVIVTAPELTSIGTGVRLNEGVILQSCGRASIRIGNDVVLSYRSTVLTGGLDYAARGTAGPHLTSDVVIEDGVWVGANAVILPGVRIGCGAVVAAGAVVTRDVPPMTVVAGVPAAVRKTFSRDGT